MRLRRYNPGLVTAIVLFLPVGGGGLWAIAANGEATAPHHMVALAVAVLVDAGIAGYGLGKARRMGPGKAA